MGSSFIEDICEREVSLAFSGFRVRGFPRFCQIPFASHPSWHEPPSCHYFATSTKNVELGMLHYSDDIDCGTRHDRQKPENDIHHKRRGKIIEVVLFVFCSLPCHVFPFMPDRFIDGIIGKLKIDRRCMDGFVE